MGEERLPLEVRDRNYHYDESIPRYYDSGNAILTFEWDALALIIPPGERFLIRSVQRLAEKARDPGLKAQIKGFIGQEAMHAKETDRSIELLEKRGLPVRRFHQWLDNLFCWINNLPFPRVMLAGTAAVEHYNAVFARWNLGMRYCRRMPAAIRDMWEWHGAEELEHRAVAFDLLQELAPRNYILRFLGFIFGIGVIRFGYWMAMRMLLKHSGLTRAQRREERQRARKMRIPLLCLRTPNLLTYLRPGFHPNQLNDGGIFKQVLSEQAVIQSRGS